MMNKKGMWRAPLVMALASAAMLLPRHQAAAAADEPAPATPLTMGEGLDQENESINLSGAACAPDGLCLLVGDEMRFARLFRLSPGAANPQMVSPGAPLYLLPPVDPARPRPDKPESDVEGVAYADGTFYIVGSHSRNKTGELRPERHVLYRIAAQALGQPSPALGTEISPSSAVHRISLDSIIMAHPFEAVHLLRAPGEGEHGLNIEGIAVRDNDMFLGFRGPVNETGALILQLDVRRLYAGIPQTPQPYRVPLGHGDSGAVAEQGVRDLAAVQGGYLILSGPEMRAAPERSDVYFWVPGQDPVHLAQLATGSGSPESMTVLNEDPSGYRLLIMNDGPGGGEPRIVRVAKPTH